MTDADIIKESEKNSNSKAIISNRLTNFLALAKKSLVINRQTLDSREREAETFPIIHLIPADIMGSTPVSRLLRSTAISNEKRVVLGHLA